MLARVQCWARAVWLTLACAAGLGFVARDVLALGQPSVMLAWLVGAGVGALSARHLIRARASPVP